MQLVNSILSKLIRTRIEHVELCMRYPIRFQEDFLLKSVAFSRETEFGRKHGFKDIESTRDFQERVPIQDYNALKPDVDRLIKGEKNLFWPGRIEWFAQSSGTASGRSKFIPVTRESLEIGHFNAGKDMLAIYCHNFPKSKLFAGKSLSIGGGAIRQFDQGTRFADLSSILLSNLPKWAEYQRTPDLSVIRTDQWDEKINLIIEQTKNLKVTSITGIPSWTLALCARLLEETGKTQLDQVWPNLEVFFHGGVSFKTYQPRFKAMFGPHNLNYQETYNASEGFFGIQDRPNQEDLLLLLDHGIFYEFIPIDELGSGQYKALTLESVCVGPIYAMVISTNGGLWRYLIGDTIRFTSIEPFRFLIAGRTSCFINVFGEELIVQNAEEALAQTCLMMNVEVIEYTVAPQFLIGETKGYHQWLVEFSQPPKSISEFAFELDVALKRLNSDYESKRQSDLLLQLPVIKSVPPGTFQKWLKSKGKLGGQHKVPRLSNDRLVIQEILNCI
ncbi:MAG: hypothetical protein ACI9FU_000271 [Granulosicoccus sp.]|jgi:hypothetical protein